MWRRSYQLECFKLHAIEHPTQNGLNNKAMHCLIWQEVEGRTDLVLVQSAAQQCLQDPGSFPLSALPTPACSSQANSLHGPKMAVQMPPANTMLWSRKETVHFHRSLSKSTEKLLQRPLRTKYQGYWSEFCNMSTLKTITNEKTGTTFLV